MKNWYLLVHFDGGAVTGFLAFNQPDQESARKAVLNQLIAKKIALVKKYGATDPYLNIRHVNAFIKAVAHPWRHTKKRFAHDESPNIRYIEFTDEIVQTDYWLEECASGTYYCNLPRYRTQDL